ncbi:amino acid/amide ABC transporter substrate-binding protein, HAAT family [Variovorax sp. YR266]|uniref:ABC transporter substrate-binding protein n=1 Tax=Variovorax sp. YR266 TaxID=1884386 RepID=UPI000897F5CA|nr:ABC transporter substrate-binding protein [Variovorax sp. YR266]SDZ21951.1 amino acid/amide ABC transporter substrate-binding protein, HAAT family [Variovorax sp. YR266]
MSHLPPKSPALPRTLLSLLLCGAVLGTAVSAAAAPVKVGLALDISGPFAALGAEARDGFALGIKQLGGKLGGQDVEFVQADMTGSPDQAKQLVDRMIQRDKIDIFSGPIGSNVALAVGPTLFNAKVPYLSANAGPSQFAGAQCNAYFFGTAYQNDQFHEAAGKFAQDRAFKKIVLIAPNYPAGKDALGGFKRQFKGQVADELYTKLGQIDYAAELAQLRAAKPDSIYFFLPGAMGINFIKQFVGAGLSKDITLVTSGFSADEDVIGAVGDPMLGLFNTSHWAHDLDNAANKAFVAAFRKEYNGRYPSVYAAQAYDAILAMDAAVKQSGGNAQNREAVVAALKKANYASTRGNFKYANNHFPIENFYLRVIGKDAQGKVTNKLINTVLTNYGDSYADKCPLK